VRSDQVVASRIPVSVLVVVYTTDAKILLLERCQPMKFWQSVTGSLEQGEVPADAALREILEETGLTDQGELTDAGRSRVFTIDSRWQNRYAPGVSENTEHEWHYRLEHSVDIRLCDAEHSAYRWFDIDDAIDAVWSWTNKEALENLKAGLK